MFCLMKTRELYRNLGILDLERLFLDHYLKTFEMGLRHSGTEHAGAYALAAKIGAHPRRP